MEQGKLPPEALAELLAGFPQDDRVRQGPGIGRDAAVVRLPDRSLVVASDPVSFSGEHLGWYAVHVNANDVACQGAEPRWFLATVLLPPGTDTESVAAIFEDLRRACAETGATLVGGHSEVSAAVSEPIVAGTMIGEAPRERTYLSDAAEPGDVLVQVGPVAIEGTALLAREIPERLRAAGLSAAEIDEAAALLFDPGISVLSMARAVWDAPDVHTLHDPTEGGIATACWEVGQASGLGITLFLDAVLVHPLTRRVGEALELRWEGLLASGSLLVTVAEGGAEAALRYLHESGQGAAIIGTLGRQGEPAILQARGETHPLPRFPRDEVARVLA